jgi:hypothetical protein
MIATTTTPTSAATGRGTDATATPRSLDDLAALDVAALTALYQGGKVSSLAALDGHPHCRMLAVRGLDRGPAASFVRWLAAHGLFPWAGKRFESITVDTGNGINRVRLGSERRWFPFETRVEPSAVDGKPAILLDYNDPRNPGFIRVIRDELREVSPGLFLGPAMLDVGKKPTLLLYFACQAATTN